MRDCGETFGAVGNAEGRGLPDRDEKEGARSTVDPV